MKYKGKRNKKRVQQRREEAIARDKERSKRSPHEQLKLLDERGVNATRERERLNEQINEHKKKETKTTRQKKKARRG